MSEDPRLLAFCSTQRQQEIMQAVIDTGGHCAAARQLKLDRPYISRTIRAIKSQAAMQGFAPEADMTHAAPAPFIVKGTSTLYDEEGRARLQWVKTRLDDQQAEEIVRAAVAALAEDAKGLSPLVARPRYTNGDLLAVYPMGDPHFGMYAWAAEAGEDFDIEIAETITLQTVDRLVYSAPNAETAIVLILGDFFHADNQSNTTPLHGYQLDVDTRYPKVLMIGIKTVRHVVLQALSKHKRVILRIEPGNHDPHAKWALALTLAAYFENNKRVTVDISPAKFWYYRFGDVLIGSTHGDTVKHPGLPGVMAADRSADWGATKHRYWYTGHIHVQTVTEFPGVICESFRTLAAKDSFSAAHGYRAGRDMYCIVHHRAHGEIERHRCDVGMLKK